MSVQIDGSTGNIIAIKADYSGDVSIGGTLTYEDVTNIDSVGLITARSGVKFGESGTTIFGNSTGIGIGEASPTRKLVVTGDTNTVAVVRGATNGTSSLFLGDSDDEDIGALTYNHPSNYLAITVNASERLRIASSGQVLLNGVTSTSTSGTSATDLLMSNGAAIRFRKGDDSAWINSVSLDSNNNLKLGSGGATSEIHFGISGIGDQMYLDSSGRLLLGTTTEGAANEAEDVTISGTGEVGITLRSTNSGGGRIYFSDGTSGTSEYAGYQIYNHSSNAMIFGTNSIERMRIDSSGRLLVGTATSPSAGAGQYTKLLSLGNTLSATGDGRLVLARGNTSANLSSGNAIGELLFTDSTGATFASIGANTDGTTGGVNGNPGRLVFYTESVGSDDGPEERMRIDSSGDVMIGTTSNAAHSDADNLIVGSTSGTHQGITINGSTSSQIRFADSGSNSVGYIIYSHSANNLQFATDGSERTRIDQNGTLSHGTTTDDPGDTNTNTGFAIRANGKYFISCAADGGHINRNNDGYVLHARRSGSHVGGISVSSSNTAFNTSSDYRLKENVVALGDAITRVKQLAPKRFNFIIEPGKTVDGFLAHEAATVVPEAVTGTHNEVDDDNNPVYQGIDTSKLVPLLTAALQEEIAKREALEARIAALEG